MRHVVSKSFDYNLQGSNQDLSPAEGGVPGIPAGDIGAASREWANRWRSIPTDSLSVGPVLATSLIFL